MPDGDFQVVDMFTRDAYSPGRLKGGGGNGTSGGMDGEILKRFEAIEARTGKVEDKLDKISDQLSAIRIDLAEVKGKLSSLPTIWQIVTLVFGILAGAFAIIKFGLPN